jgi:dienelactone hydrolase
MTSDALPTEVIRLWPDGPPSKLEGVAPESEFRGLDGVSAGTLMLRNISEPTLTVFRPQSVKPNGIGVIVCPGGGWRILAWEHEGVDVARWHAERGYTAFLLKYRVMGTPAGDAEFAAAMAATSEQLSEPRPASKAPRSLNELGLPSIFRKAREMAADDGRRAISLVREGAKTWNIAAEKVGMVGFSAGAFLAADVAVDPRAAPLAFVAPIYGGETQGRSVPADAPGLFTVIAEDDRLLFKVVEGLYADWSNADRAAELHIFTRGGHGFGLIRQGLPVDRWIDLYRDWLIDRGLG